jgi:hypothetical protein
MSDAIRVKASADLLRDQVDVIILKVLGNSRDESNTDSRTEQSADPADKLRARVLLVTRRVTVDNVPEDQRVKQREDLVDRREKECGKDKSPVVPEIPPECGHLLKITHTRSELREPGGIPYRPTSKSAPQPRSTQMPRESKPQVSFWRHAARLN